MRVVRVAYHTCARPCYGMTCGAPAVIATSKDFYGKARGAIHDAEDEK